MGCSTSPFASYIVSAAQAVGIDPDLFLAQMNQESGCNPAAVSPAGCQGIAQICDEVPFSPSDPFASIDYAAQRMRTALATFGGWPGALASYNAGPASPCARSNGQSGCVPETTNYIASILGSAPSGATAASGAPQVAWNGSHIADIWQPMILVVFIALLFVGFSAAHGKKV